MAIYTYDEQDFKNASQINIEDLQKIITDSAISSAEVSYITYETKTVSTFVVDVVFDGTLSGGDITILNGIIEAYEYYSYADITATLKDLKSVGTNGGTFTKSAWRTRDLNTLSGDVNFVTLSSNQFTLIAGSYTITAKAPACDVRNHQIRLYNITDASLTSMGSNAFSWGGVMTSSDIYTTITISATKTYEIQHICSDTSTNIGFGKATGFNTDELYTTVLITKNS